MKTKKTMLGTLLLLSYQCSISPSVISPPMDTTPYRSVGASSSILYEANYFYNANYYFLGAKNANQTDGAFARAYVFTNNATTPATRSVGIKRLAPQTAFVNHQATTRKEEEKKANPLYNASINQIVLSGGYPVLAVKAKNPADTTAPAGDNQTICQVTDKNEGLCLFCNIVKLKDANEADTSGIVSIAASSRQIFAAVAPAGGAGAFGGAGSGVTVLMGKDASLAPINATTGKEGNKAVAVLPLAGTNIIMNDHVAMHWNARLNRLFVGLDLEHNNGGTAIAHGLLVGQVTNNIEPKLTLEPFIPASAMAAPDAHNYITGFQSDNLNAKVKIHNIKTMETSTNKMYVIVNGNVYDNGITTTEVFAIPVVNKVYTDQAPADGDIGKAAVKTDVNQNTVVSADGEITKQSEAAAKVGGGVAPDGVIFMHVMGDTVYVCCAHASTGGKQGIFASTAIFGANGLIEAWTPWQRVMGAVDKVYGMGIDVANTNIWYLTETTNPGDRVKVTQWDIEDTTLLGNLINELRDAFDFENGGVHQLFNFDRYAGSFLSSDFSMMVATGYKKVALIRTGKPDGSGGFIPTAGTDFSTNLATNFKVYTDQALQDIGPICAADISRELTGATDDNWLFVGGYNGLAVLRNPTDGTGWDELSSLGDIATFTFKKIGNFKRVHKIVCDDYYLYVLTPRALYRIELDPDKFKDTSPIALDAEVIARPENLPTCNRFDTFLDFIISTKVGILATSSGLYRIANGGNIKTSSTWTEVKSASGYSLGPVTHLFPQSLVMGFFERGGNLCVVAGNESNELASVIRFNVADTYMSAIDDNTIQPITEYIVKTTDPTRDYFYPFGEFRSSFVTNGTFGIHSLSKHFGSVAAIFGNSKPARIIRMIPSVPAMRSKEMALSLGLNENANNSGIPVLNTASGAWMIPGHWAVKIHE